MKALFTISVFSLILFLTFSTSAQQPEGDEFFVVPTAYTSSVGTGIFIGPLTNTARTYQLLIHENQLTNLVNKELKGLSWRLPTSATANWPPAEATYTSYDIYLSESVPPANRDFTFANNVVGPQTLVRSGSLVISLDSYTFGNAPNNFGTEISFNTNYLYSGGHLLIELRHTGNNSTSRTVDAVTSSTPGYLSDFSACWASGYTTTTGGLNGNFSIVRLTADDPIPVELSSFTAIASGNNVQLKWITASEINNYGFEVEMGNISTD